MVLTRADDWPIHQTPEPIACPTGERNFYDRYFFNGYSREAGDDRMFGLAFGAYPQLGVVDAAFSWMADGRQASLFASRWLRHERMALDVGPIAIEVVEPLRRLRVRVDAPDRGVRADLLFAGRHFPVEEPRFTRRVGARLLLDYTRLTQNGAYEGWVEMDGARAEVSGWTGTRDRSWGVRPVGARDPQAPAPAQAPQFFWLWSPCAFPDGDLFFHTNDDEHGRPWNRRAVWTTGEGERTFETAEMMLRWRPGTRAAADATLSLGGGGEVAFRPVADFLMLGIGYGHPERALGVNQGELVVAREDHVTADADRRLPHHFHVQALSEATWTGGDGRERTGRGVLEQLAIGAHAPSGFAGLTDVAG